MLFIYYFIHIKFIPDHLLKLRHTSTGSDNTIKFTAAVYVVDNLAVGL